MDRLARPAPALLACCLLLTACPSSRDEGALPTASAGPAASAAKGAAVVLDGTASRGPDGWTGTLRYAWRQTAGTAVSLSDPTSPTPSFLAPRVGGPLTFSLVVTADRPSPASTVTITVLNQIPVASAGADLAVHGAWIASLDGSASHDPDGDPLSYTWVQLAGPPVTLDTLAPGWARFTAPGAVSTLRFLLVVSDGEATAEDEVAVEVVEPATDLPPVADAGPDLVASRSSYVTLSGTAYDPDGLGGMTITWEQVSGTPVTLYVYVAGSAWFYSPAELGDLEFRLTVTSGGLTASDTMVVHVQNVPPTISSVSISPAQPRTDDELRATASAFDPEGDPVTLAYAWQRNGAEVAGQAGPTFPASLTTKGDVITVTVTASDGTGATTATATVTIEDSPPVVGITFPAELQHGTAGAGQATTVDPDGDPVASAALSLAFGPPGMTVDADGAIRWTPTLPMFDWSLDVRFGVRFAADPASVATATVRVVDAARAPAMRRAGLQRPLTGESMRARDLDGDGRDELLVLGAAGPYELRRVGDGYAMGWTAPFRADRVPTTSYAAASSAVEAADLDGDGAAEIFFSDQEVLFRLDGATRRVAAETVAGLNERFRACEAADVDLDGKVELACLVSTDSYGSTGRLVLLDAASLSTLWETATLQIGRSLAVGNVDADAALEIVTAGGFVYDGASRANQWAYSPGFGAQVEIGHPVAGGAAQIIGGFPLRGFSATLKTPLWQAADPGSGAFAVRDLDGDGADELLLAPGSYYSTLQGWRWVGGTAVLEQVFSATFSGYQSGAQALVTGDFDGDGVAEAAWDGSGASYSSGVLSIAGPLSAQAALAWQAANPATLDGPMSGARLARTGAGATRLAFQSARTDESSGGARVVLLDPDTGLLSTSQDLGSNWARASGLAAADYDADGVDELFVAAANVYDPTLLAWDPATGLVAWTGPVMPTSYSSTTIAGLEAGDLDADGTPELVALAGDGAIWILDVLDQTLLWKSVALGSASAMALVDLDGDGRPEVVAAAGGRVVAYGWLAAAGTFVELAATSLPYVSDLAAGDCDGDGVPEVYVLGGDSYYYAETSTVTRLDAALQPVGSFTLPRATSLFVEDLGGARKNLAASILASRSVYGNGLNELAAFDAVSGAEIWRSPPLHGPVTRDSATWLQLGGAWRLALGTDRSMYLTR